MSETLKSLDERQKENRSRTTVLIGFFIVFLGFIGIGLDFAFFGRATGFPIATIGALLVGAFSAYWSLHGGDKTILASTHARPLNLDNPKEKMLDNILEEMAVAAGLPKPVGYIVPDADPNAFATGPDPQHSSLAVTQSLLDMMDREELQGVIGHEMSHVRDYDTRYMTVLAALGGAVLLLASFGRGSMSFGGGFGNRDRDNRGAGGGAILMLFWLVAIVLAPLVAQLITLAVSRQREYLADATGAELTRNPLGLASALTKIADNEVPSRMITAGVGHLCIADPRGRALNESESGLANWFSDHPPIRKRIAILQGMAYKQG